MAYQRFHTADAESGIRRSPLDSPDAGGTVSTDTLTFLGLSDFLPLKPVEMITVPYQAQFEKPAAVESATIAHVDKAATLLERHLGLLNGARARLLDTANSDGPGARLLAFYKAWIEDADGQGDADVKELLGPYVDEIMPAPAAPGLTNQYQLRPRPQLAISQVKVTPPANAGPDAYADNDASALFKLSRHAMDDFHYLSGQRDALERLKQRKLVALRESAKRSVQLEREIAAARSEYAALDRTRLAAEEDYTLVRGLLEEQLQAVDDAFVERAGLLSSPVALCYVRVSDLPVRIERRATSLIPRVAPGQLPVACESAGELPERLTPFQELLADQPMSAWRALADKRHLLPPAWVYQPPTPILPGYPTAIRAMPAAFRGLAKSVPMPMVQRVAAVPGYSTAAVRASQAELARQAAERVTLEQLTTVRNAALRIAARRLQDDLARALSCLLDQLLSLPATDRFAWSRLAEDDRLAVEAPQRWPGFEAHRRSTAGLQLRMIVEWLFAQLADNAPTESRTAVRTTLRACLLHTVNDDPAELLEGDVVQFPGLWKPGVLIGTTLNRVPMLKAPLRVYDAERRLIGEARVVDSQPQSQQVAMVATKVQAQGNRLLSGVFPGS